MTDPEEVGPGTALGREEAELHAVSEIGKHRVDRAAHECDGYDREYSDECEYQCVLGQSLPSLRAKNGTDPAELHFYFTSAFSSSGVTLGECHPTMCSGDIGIRYGLS